MSFNPTGDTFFAALAGIRMAVPEFELSPGVVLRAVYAHFTTPFMVGFQRPDESNPRRLKEPLYQLAARREVDVEVELQVPAELKVNDFLSRLKATWWLAALARLRGASQAHVPFLSSVPLSEIPKSTAGARIVPMEVNARAWQVDSPLAELAEADLQWIRSAWLSGGRLLLRSDTFHEAVVAIDAAGELASHASALLALWGALERLYSPGRQELSFRIAAGIATYLEPPGPSRLELHKSAKKLYDNRSMVAHGGALKSPEALLQTFAIAARSVARMIEEGRVPEREWLERELFAPSQRSC